MVDDRRELAVVERRLGGAMVTTMDTDPDRVTRLEPDTRRAASKCPGEKGVQTRRVLAWLLNEARPLVWPAIRRL